MKKFFNEFLLCLALSIILLPSITTKAEEISNSNDTTLSQDEAVELSEDETNINTEDVVEVFCHGENNLSITQSDIDLLAKLVYAESRGEPFDGKIAVASVVLNRVLDESFPNTINEVIFQKNAFSCVHNGNIIAYPDQSCFQAVYEALQGADPTNEALFFYNPTISTSSWMLSTKKYDELSIGQHVFFKA